MPWIHASFDPTTAETTTDLAVVVGLPACAGEDEDWRPTPVVSYTSTTVTITLRLSDAFRTYGRCGFVLDVYRDIKVHLDQPLRGRALLDGYADPPIAKPYPAPRTTPPPTADLLILSVSDWRGQVEPLSGIGGAAALSTYFQRDRAASTKGTLTLTAGSDVGASPPLSAYFLDTPAIEAERMMGVQVGMLGNHSFDAGLERVQGHIDNAGFNSASSRYHYVAANLGDRDSNLDGVADYEIFDYDVRVAVIGIVDEQASRSVAPGGLGTMTVTNGVAAAMAAKAAAKAEGAEIFIAITDKGVTDVTGADPKGPLIEFATAVSGFDLIVGGQTDVQYSGTVNGQLVVENRSKGVTYAKSFLTIDRLSRHVTAARNTFVSPAVASVAADPDVMAMLRGLRSRMPLTAGGASDDAPSQPMPSRPATTPAGGTACAEAMRQFSAFLPRLTDAFASLRAPITEPDFDLAEAMLVQDRFADTLTAFWGVDPAYHGCDSISESVSRVGGLVARASATLKQSQAARTMDARWRRAITALYGSLPEAAEMTDLLGPQPASGITP